MSKFSRFLTYLLTALVAAAITMGVVTYVWILPMKTGSTKLERLVRENHV